MHTTQQLTSFYPIGVDTNVEALRKSIAKDPRNPENILPGEPRMIEVHICALFEGLEMLNDLQSNLQNRLEPILSPEAIHTADREPTEVVEPMRQSELSNELSNAIRQVTRFRISIADIIDRLEI